MKSLLILIALLSFKLASAAPLVTVSAYSMGREATYQGCFIKMLESNHKDYDFRVNYCYGQPAGDVLFEYSQPLYIVKISTRADKAVTQLSKEEHDFVTRMLEQSSRTCPIRFTFEPKTLELKEIKAACGGQELAF